MTNDDWTVELTESFLYYPFIIVAMFGRYSLRRLPLSLSTLTVDTSMTTASCCSVKLESKSSQAGRVRLK